MTRLVICFALLFLTTSLPAQETHHDDPTTLALGAAAPDFNLKGIDGKFHSLKEYSAAKALVIVFNANHCPTAQAYEDRIINITQDYKSKGVTLIVISSNNPPALNLAELGYTELGDTFEEMIVRAKDKAFNFPYLYDGDDQKVALAYGPVATPHAFVFDKDRRLQYAGRIDQHEKPGTGKGEDLRQAIDAVLAGRKPEPANTKVFGCSMKWSWKNEYTQKLMAEWAAMPVTLNEIDVTGVQELLKNKGDKLRLINIWATWCGPCTQEFPDFITIDRMYRGRDFEFIAISADKIASKEKALKFLKLKQAANANFIFNKDNIYDLIEAVDPKWQGALPYTVLVEPGGKIVYSQQGPIDPLKMKKLIVENALIGRYY
ncbi:redoxin family protein [Chryseolinea lacunae]|uniref:Redoxin domain-containing protein n=1 Tax=Chryseolinea lacunae TaxID=2801331 RepID=A0ABS1KL46_9BACT|nr:redoxin domain-containing protein [Chryseolinea lacunae]MBL0740059.1 redoxin domain-containing protein [Chryseolinea lacunae]